VAVAWLVPLCGVRLEHEGETEVPFKVNTHVMVPVGGIGLGFGLDPVRVAEKVSVVV
jgi:hypothetical protein